MKTVKKRMTMISAALVTITLIVSLFGCGRSETDPTRTEKIVEEIAIDYGTYGPEAAERIEKLLGELSSADASAGVRWKNIIGIWTSGELGKTLNYGVLPDGLPDTDELCIVVLGFQLEPDGSMKEELVNRLTVALNSAKKYPDAYIVCTGGGTAAENGNATEAGEMAKWLEKNGIDKKRIIVEDTSITT
ncbi:MAG: YdcF family protein, partial [Clostridia bacterium]|nr:YdcF family protein [Clostridia bacterium]